MSDQPPTTSIEIPDRIARDIAARREGTDFESVDAYAARALDELLAALDRRDVEDDRGEVGTPDDRVAGRLESLGYL